MPRTLPNIRRLFRQAGRIVVDMSDSANLYLTPGQGKLYEAVLADASYRESVAEPLAQAAASLPALLQSVASIDSRQALTVVDCGPATAVESIRKLKALREVSRIRRYVAVDVNSRLLSKVKTGVHAELDFPVTTIHKRFEELDSLALREHATGKVLLLFGSTCMNYEPAGLLRLMHRLSFPGMLISLESILRNSEPCSASPYDSEAVMRFVFGPLGLTYASPEDFRFRSVAANGRVRLEFVARRKVSLRHPRAPTLRSGDRIWTAFSRRPTLEEHQEELARMTGRFDTFVLENRVAASLGQVA